MTVEQAKTLLPELFVVANTQINVEVVNKLGSKFGYWDPYRNKLVIAVSAVDCDGEVVEFSEEQILNTYWHEWFHCWQFFYDNEASESMAQTFANFMCEYQSTKNK